MKRLVGIGDSLFLYQDKKEDIEYIIKDSGIFLANGSYIMGFILMRKDDGTEEFTPEYIVMDLINNLDFYTNSNKQITDRLREARNKNKE